jgi:hypothetical protein
VSNPSPLAARRNPFPLTHFPFQPPAQTRHPPYPEAVMTTPLRAAASRANGARSKGPVTPAGKRNSSRNATRHGMLAQTVVLDGESQERFHELLTALTLEFRPRTPTEAALVETMAIARWRQMRIWGIQKAAFDLEMARHQDAADSPPIRAAIVFRHLADNSRVLDLAQRYETAFDRQFSRALALLLKLRAVPDGNPAPTPVARISAVTWEFPEEPSNSLKTLVAETEKPAAPAFLAETELHPYNIRAPSLRVPPCRNR